MAHLGSSLLIIGDIDNEDDDLIIDARVRGRIRVRNAALTIGPRGRIDGDIRGARVIIRGQVQGSVWASERIDVMPTAIVNGSLSANHVVIVDGATVNARVDMDRRTIAARVARYRAGQAGAPA